MVNFPFVLISICRKAPALHLHPVMSMKIFTVLTNMYSLLSKISLNLHNGLFNVNMSNEQGLNFQKLDVPNVVTDELVTFEHEAYMLLIVYSFGTIHFIFELIHNEL